MGELLCKLAVIRENEQAFSLRVEPADVEKLRKFLRKQIEDRVAGMGVFARGDKTGRLVQHDRERRIEMQQPAIDFNVIARGRLRAEVGADLAVNHHASSCDQFVAMTARTDASGGEVAIEAHGIRKSRFVKS